MIVAPSVLAADFLNLEKDIERVESTDAEWLHLDVMDGNFVKNISFGMDLIRDIAGISTKFLDVHLMVEHPDNFLDYLIEIGVGSISVHQEVISNFNYRDFLKKAQGTGIKVGIVFNPSTSIEESDELIVAFDFVLIMSVVPGAGGQKFMPDTLKKVEYIRLIEPNKFIQVDGGVNDMTIQSLKDANIDCCVAGSYLFAGEGKMQERINNLR